MFKIGRAKSLNDVDIVFQVPNTINSCTQYAYKFLNIDEKMIEKTKAVSGLDYNKPINCLFNIEQQQNHNHMSFVMSMFRAPCLYPDVVERANLNVVKVVTNNYQEYWYVLNVKKGGGKSARSTVYQKMRANHIEYDIITCYLSGNVPIELIRAFNNKLRNKFYLHSLMITSPAPETDNNTIDLIKWTNSTA
ncbi:ac146 [Psilogramma increta granulovirus]|uniref:Ac146 n=1 Tax=Psilogramma increta granulovirus TaxID=2953508 RepID=A0A977TNV2_9BBAC|nr:ac146 [Psilogramma increta granulovirus]